MKRYIVASPEMDLENNILQTFGSPNPSTGCSFIAKDGTFVNIYPKLDVHEDLCEWVSDNFGVEIEFPDEEYFIRLFGWIRLRSDPHMMIIELPGTQPTNDQWWSLDDWLSHCEEKYPRGTKLDISVCDDPRIVNVQYLFNKDYLVEDMLKILKRYYSSGKLYSNTQGDLNMKRYIRSSEYTMDYEDKKEVMRWLDIAEKRIWKFCKEHNTGPDIYYEIDDVSWGTDCINVPVFRGSFTNTRKYTQIDNFRFCYDPDDVFERNADEQLNDKLDEFLDSLGYKIGDHN